MIFMMRDYFFPMMFPFYDRLRMKYIMMVNSVTDIVFMVRFPLSFLAFNVALLSAICNAVLIEGYLGGVAE